MRQDIIEILTALASGKKPFYGQDNLSDKGKEACRLKLLETSDIVVLNKFFEDEIAHIIFHSHNTHLAYR